MIFLDRTSKIPLYEQLYKHLRTEIAVGKLQKERKLSSTRELALQLNISRNTVELAYGQLCAEGYVDNRPGSGYYVNPLDTELLCANTAYAFPKRAKKSPDNGDSRKYHYNLQYGVSNIDDFPLKKWKKALDKAFYYGESNQLTTYKHNDGSPSLRQELASYLERSRGVKCHFSQIIICSSTQSIMERILHLLSHDFQPLITAMEDPGYDGVYRVLKNHQCTVLPISVNSDGISVEKLRQTEANAVYVTPSHQFPSGAILPIQKRLELLRWANETNGYIIEDDYDSELRYEGIPIPCMQGLDRYDRVIYLGTFSKALAPGLRVSYMVLPRSLQANYDRLFYNYHNTVPALIQNALANLMMDGDWTRHLRKMCQSNKKKHDLLIALLQERLSGRVKLKGKGAGLHIILESLSASPGETLIIERAERMGLKIYPVSKYYISDQAPSANSVMIGFGGLNLEQIPHVVNLLCNVYGEASL